MPEVGSGHSSASAYAASQTGRVHVTETEGAGQRRWKGMGDGFSPLSVSRFVLEYRSPLKTCTDYS